MRNKNDFYWKDWIFFTRWIERHEPTKAFIREKIQVYPLEGAATETEIQFSGHGGNAQHFRTAGNLILSWTSLPKSRKDIIGFPCLI